MSSIRILPESVANQIAAGEVVERPASVVKELLENSLDAGGESVEVAVEAGGKRLIRVVDDGCGMSHDDTLLALERHATSKIRSAEDLLEISTLGFRGEALPSIAAVSRLSLETRHASEKTGTRLEIAGGKLRDVQEIAWSRGTRIEVHDLFFNTPARRKFLKSESTELAHIATLVTHYALAHPGKSFRLLSLAHEILNVSPVVNHRERIYQVMGRQLLEQLIEIAPVERRMAATSPADAGQDASAFEEAPTIRVSGFISRPEVEKLNRNQIYFFVNRRLIRDRLILHAIADAYRNILPGSVFPVALIFLDLPAAEVDVNVHPSKSEVRFRHSGFIHDFVRDSMRQALIAARPVAAFPLPKRAQAEAREDVDVEIGEKLVEGAPLMRGATPPPGDVAVHHAGRTALEFRLASPEPTPKTGDLPLTKELSGLPHFDSLGWQLAPAQSGNAPRPGDAAPVDAHPEEYGVEISRSRAGRDEFPIDLRPLGQVEDSFIVATNADGLWIIDQHVAHERVLFERHLRLRREKKVEVQRLLMPIIVELKAEQQATFHDLAEELAANGFEAEPFGQRTVAVKTAPADISGDHVERLLLEILDGVGREARTLTLDLLLSKIAASVSCHAAIKVNNALDRSKMDWLLRELAKTECPMTCPHGRPIVLQYSLKEIEKAFKRI
jgi:DNA mismatch repair protein MutL